jgi:hypothetical protein
MDLSHLLDSAPESPLQTQRTPVPEGEYAARIDDITLRNVTTKAGERPIMTVHWEIIDEALKAKLSRDRIIVRQDIWIDLDEMGGIDTGPDRNVNLGALRNIFGLNEPGVPIGALKGTPPALIQVRHRQVEGREDVFTEVGRVAPLRR